MPGVDGIHTLRLPNQPRDYYIKLRCEWPQRRVRACKQVPEKRGWVQSGCAAEACRRATCLWRSIGHRQLRVSMYLPLCCLLWPLHYLFSLGITFRRCFCRYILPLQRCILRRITKHVTVDILKAGDRSVPRWPLDFSLQISEVTVSVLLESVK